MELSVTKFKLVNAISMNEEYPYSIREGMSCSPQFLVVNRRSLPEDELAELRQELTFLYPANRLIDC